MSEEPSEEPIQKKSSALHALISVLAMIACVLALSFGLRTFIFEPYEIPSGSMETTIMTGDMVFSEKITYYTSSPKAGDIVTFTDPTDSSRTLIKRVIATEGQTITLENGVVCVDGTPLDEPYTNSKPSYELQSAVVTYPYTVPTGYIWVMGDNRTNSSDSRYFGAVPVSSVTGRAFVIYWPLDRIGLLE